MAVECFGGLEAPYTQMPSGFAGFIIKFHRAVGHVQKAVMI